MVSELYGWLCAHLMSHDRVDYNLQKIPSVLGALVKRAVSGTAKVGRKLRKRMKTRKRWLDNRDCSLLLSRYYKLPPRKDNLHVH